jgi:hypothetical protein
MHSAAEAQQADGVWPKALAEAFFQQSSTAQPQPPSNATPQPPRTAAAAADVHKLRGEISRLELLVKKLQTELQIERQYNQALEIQFKNFTQVD